MIATLISLEDIELAYVEQIDPEQHVLLEQKTEGVYTVIKQGPAIRQLLLTMLQIKSDSIEEQNQNNLSSPLFVCFSPKPMKLAQPIFQALSPQFQSHLLYFRLDKHEFSQICFNRAVLEGRQICYGEGLSQLRPKEELRIVLGSVLKQFSCIQYIFVERNPNELKELKKEGFINVIDLAGGNQGNRYREAYQVAVKNSSLQGKGGVSMKEEKEEVQVEGKYAKDEKDEQEGQQGQQWGRQYLQLLKRTGKDTKIKQIKPFDCQQLTIQAFLNQLYTTSSYYNITPKSWVGRPNSKQVCSYVFHSMSDSRLYVARSAKPKDFSNQEDYQLKILSHYLSFLVNPEGLSVPHDKNTTLMKMCKVKSYENKKAFLNIRPYIEGLATVSELVSSEEAVFLLQTGCLYGRKVRGVGGLLLLSWLINQSFTLKTFAEQVAFVEVSPFTKVNSFVSTVSSLRGSEGELVLCRTDYFSPFNSHDFKLLQDNIPIHRSRQTSTIKMSQLSQCYLQQIQQLLASLTEERMLMIKNLFIYYRWNTKLSPFYEMLLFRLNAIREYFSPLSFDLARRESLLVSHPQLACLMMSENYSKFMLPEESPFYPLEYNYQEQLAVKKTTENPYLSYLSKTCSFGIQQLDFPILSYLQWVKSTGMYQVIEYISMINHSIEDYQILDKRLKLTHLNDKKSVLLVVDHVELADDIVARPKSIKTVMLFRLRKSPQLNQTGMIADQSERKPSIEQSQDELISVLHRWGQASQLFPSKFTLHEWVFQSYSAIRCQLYSLDPQQNQTYLLTLHKSMTTNRHRLKQLQETHGQSCRHLYTYPILKENQKIVFNYRFFEYLHVKLLFGQILSREWNHRLATHQNVSVGIVNPLIDAGLAEKVVRELFAFLEEAGQRKAEGLGYQSEINDALEIIKTLTQPPSNSELRAPFHLYYQVFPELVKIHNYLHIQETFFFGDTLAVVADEDLQLLTPSCTDKLPLNNSRILAVTNTDNRLILLSSDLQTHSLFLSELPFPLPLQSPQAPCLISKPLHNKLLNSILLNQSWSKMLLSLQANILYVIFHASSKMVVIAIDVETDEQVQYQEYQLERPFISLNVVSIVGEGSWVVVADIKAVFRVHLAQSNPQLPLVPLLTVNYGIGNALFFTSGSQLHVLIHKLHVIEHYWVIGRQITGQNRYELPRNVKTLALQDGLLYILYDNCDCLDIARLDQQLTRVCTYHWIDPNATALFIHGRDLFLRGLSYVKHIRLRELREDKEDKQDKLDNDGPVMNEPRRVLE